MEIKVFLTIFVTVFLAEIGDKTQIATMLFATDQQVNRLLVFAAASAALVLSSAIGVFAGSLLSQYIDPDWLNRIAAVGFIVIGAWMLFASFNTAQ